MWLREVLWGDDQLKYYTIRSILLLTLLFSFFGLVYSHTKKERSLDETLTTSLAPSKTVDKDTKLVEKIYSNGDKNNDLYVDNSRGVMVYNVYNRSAFTNDKEHVKSSEISTGVKQQIKQDLKNKNADKGHFSLKIKDGQTYVKGSPKED